MGEDWKIRWKRCPEAYKGKMELQIVRLKRFGSIPGVKFECLKVKILSLRILKGARKQNDLLGLDWDR